MTFLELKKNCKAVGVDCDKCQSKDECSNFSKIIENASPIKMLKIAEDWDTKDISDYV